MSNDVTSLSFVIVVGCSKTDQRYVFLYVYLYLGKIFYGICSSFQKTIVIEINTLKTYNAGKTGHDMLIIQPFMEALN